MISHQHLSLFSDEANRFWESAYTIWRINTTFKSQTSSYTLHQKKVPLLAPWKLKDNQILINIYHLKNSNNSIILQWSCPCYLLYIPNRLKAEIAKSSFRPPCLIKVIFMWCYVCISISRHILFKVMVLVPRVLGTVSLDNTMFRGCHNLYFKHPNWNISLL